MKVYFHHRPLELTLFYLISIFLGLLVVLGSPACHAGSYDVRKYLTVVIFPFFSAWSWLRQSLSVIAD